MRKRIAQLRKTDLFLGMGQNIAKNSSGDNGEDGSDSSDDSDDETLC
jgi:hypothetical protein